MKVPYFVAALVLGICTTFTTARPPPPYLSSKYPISHQNPQRNLPSTAKYRNSPVHNPTIHRNSQLKPPIIDTHRNPISNHPKSNHPTSNHDTDHPKTPTGFTSPPFKIQIFLSVPTSLSSLSSPTSSSPISLLNHPIYLLPNGSTTTESELAAICHTTLTSRLYCGNAKTPIGAATDVGMSLLSGVRGSEELGMGGKEKGIVHGGWEVEGTEWGGVGKVGEEGGKRKELKWKRKDKKEKARFVFRDELEMGNGNGGGTVWAAFEDVGDKRSTEGLEVDLVAVFE